MSNIPYSYLLRQAFGLEFIEIMVSLLSSRLWLGQINCPGPFLEYVIGCPGTGRRSRPLGLSVEVIFAAKSNVSGVIW